MSEGVVAAAVLATPELSQHAVASAKEVAQAGQPHLVAGLLSLPKACSEFTRRGEWRAATAIRRR